MMRQYHAVPLLVLVMSAPILAQGYFPIPNQVSLGLGVVRDQEPDPTAPTVVFSFAFADSGTNNWPSRLGLVWEAELVSTGDAAFLVGLRSHAFRRHTRRVMPFASVLIGGYGKGAGVDDAVFESRHFALQGGGGIDLRRSGSVHGVRLSVDYRRVFSTSADGNQLKFVTSYVLGPPEPQPPAGSPAPRP